MTSNDSNQDQQLYVLNGNVQENIPQPQDDPPLRVNQQTRRNGDLTLTSNLSFEDSSVKTVRIPITSMPAMFAQVFDSTEANFSTDNELSYDRHRYSPTAYTYTPNIAKFLGNIIIGQELGVKYLESIMIGCAMYLDGVAEILPEGDIRILDVRRDTSKVRYRELCIIIYYSLSSFYNKARPTTLTLIEMYQSLMQEIYGNASLTSVYTRIKRYQSQGQLYDVSRAAIRRWALDTPWHALMYNNQAPLTKEQFVDLFFKMYSVNTGQELRYATIHPNDQTPSTLNPNSPLFTALLPDTMVARMVDNSADIPMCFITFIRYYLATDYIDLKWRDIDETSSDDDDDDSQTTDSNENERLDGTPRAEEMDESDLGM